MLKDTDTQIQDDPALVVEREIDPDCVNRSFYLITANSREAVQTAIASLIAEVESFGNGCGNFIGPHRSRDLRYFAIGTVMVFPDIGALG